MTPCYPVTIVIFYNFPNKHRYVGNGKGRRIGYNGRGEGGWGNIYEINFHQKRKRRAPLQINPFGSIYYNPDTNRLRTSSIQMSQKKGPARRNVQRKLNLIRGIARRDCSLLIGVNMNLLLDSFSSYFETVDMDYPKQSSSLIPAGHSSCELING